MKNFGKMTFSPETVEQHGQDYKVLILRDENGLDWFDLVKDHPHPFYIAVNDDGLIFSMEQDYQAIQTEGVLIGIDSDFGFTRGPSGSVYGKIWNGTAIVDPQPEPEPIPDEISRRQFFQQLANMRIISRAEALAAIQTGAIPAPLQAIIDSLPTEDDKFDALMLVAGAQDFNRARPLAEIVRQAMQWTVEQKDNFWRNAKKL